MNHDKIKGFTLIELTLAMSFIALLLIAITLTILQISNIYNTGITLKEVNQVGQSVTSELQNAIAESPPFSIASGTGSRYIQETGGGKTLGGRLCLGQYSYIWNDGIALSSGYTAPNLYASPSAANELYFVKDFDPNASDCTKSSGPNGVYPDIDPTKATELLTNGQQTANSIFVNGDQDLAVQSFTISSPTNAINTVTDQELYTINITIGTNDQNALTYNKDGSISCSPPGVANSDPAYCAVTTFNIVALAGNGVQ